MNPALTPNVLLIDDNLIDLTLLENILENQNINIIKASSGPEALMKIKGIDLALALIDIEMPHMNGFEFVKLMRSNEKRRTVPIIFLTAYSNGDAQLIKGYEAGAVDYLLKPYNINILLSKISVFLDLDKQKSLLIESKNKLEESKERLQAIYENIPGGILLIGKDYIIRDVNDETCAITGFQKEELIGQLCDKLCPKGSASKDCPVWIHNQTDFKGMDTTIKCSDGRNNPILKNAKQVHYDGESYILEVFQDTLELKLAQAAIFESEEKYRTLVEKSLQGIVVIVEEQVVFANESFARMTGYSIEEIKKFSVAQLASIFCIGLIDGLKTTDGQTESLSNEYKGVRKDGLACWLQISANRINYGGKKALQGTIIDITKRKLAEEALVESENMYRTLLNASPEGILIIDLAGRISEVSSIMLEIFGTENKHDLVGKHFIRFIHKESLKKVREVVEKTMAEGLEQDVEFILIKADQKKFVGEVSTTLIQESNGTPQSFMAIVRDISQRKEIEKQLIHTERMAGLGEMATGIAHEINQPLNTISMSLENMLMEISKTKEKENSYLSIKINKIFESIYRIGKIIDHIRAFSRDHDDYIPTAFNINESIMNSLSMVMVQYKHKAIDLITDLSEDISPVIGNTFKFEQVILNLIINAKDALEEKALTEDFEKRIMIHTFQEEGSIHIEVSDNGTGIKKEDISNIMLPFYSTKEEGKGTGMGLAISFGIIKEMKGDIQIQSKVLKGTSIRITIPVGNLNQC